MKPSTRTVNLAGREIGCSCHACAFFHTDDQFYKVLLPFIREGFTAGDNGIGIHPDFLPHVFQPFRQGESNPTTGLGLGLGIVKNLVELHGGSVAAESPGVGCGSRFTIALPCAASTP
jgi:signal transduction histidine kinase